MKKVAKCASCGGKMKTGGTAKKKMALGGVAGDPLGGKSKCKSGKCGPGAAGAKAKVNKDFGKRKFGKVVG